MTRMIMRNGIVVLLCSFIAGVCFGAPTFTDQGWDSGYVNPHDQVIVQKIKIVDGSSTINSFSIRNLGTADENDITRIVIDDDNDPFTSPLGEFTDLTGLRTGLHFAFDYPVPDGTSYLWIGVEIAGAADVAGGETIQFEVRFYAGTYTSDYITDGSPETIFKGGFELKEDDSPPPSYLNPGDSNVLVQKATFTDKDGNNSPVKVTKVSVKNLENADHNDVVNVQVKVTGKVGGAETTYTANKAPSAADWGSGDPIEFGATEFGGDWPPTFDDDGSLTVEVKVTIGGTTDKHKIQTLTTLTTEENGETYDQLIQATSTHTIRVQGFEATSDVSEEVLSGVKSPGEDLVQKVTATDDDVNNFDVTANGIWIKNLGTATAADITKIVVKRMDTGTVLLTLNSAEIQDFNTGHFYAFDINRTVLDDESATFGIYYTIADNVTPGVTLRPQVYIRGQENGINYASDTVTYPNAIALYPHGLETVANVSPPNGGTAYSGQRLLAQKIRCVDIDENNDGVWINPVRVRNVASSPCTASEISKIEVRTEDGALLGEETDVSALLTTGVPISTLDNNLVPDNEEVVLCIYVTFAGPEDVTAGHKLKLETTIFSEEDGHTGNQTVIGPEWTLEINNRPVVDFNWSPTDPTWEDTITFTPQNVSDPDGDALVEYRWDFGDGSDPVVETSAQSVTHEYPDGGTFTVTLTVTDERGLAGTKSKEITVEGRPNQPPTADFDWAPTEPEAGDVVTFTADADDPDDPPDTPLTYAWDFGDGTTLAASEDNQEVTHTYANAGTYTVTLTVTDSRGAQTVVEHDITVVEAVNAPPTITQFSASTNTPAVNQEVTFTANAADDENDEITDWEWDFGDGTTSTAAPPVTHTYTKTGFITVKVRAKDGNGSNTFGPWASLEIYVRGPGAADIGTKLAQNPVATQAAIEFLLPQGAENPVLRVFDLLGRLVFQSDAPVGDQFTWDLVDRADRAVPNGLYFYLITAALDGRTIRSEVGRILVVR